MGVNTQGPLTFYRKGVIHLKGLEGMAALKHLFELRTQRSQFKEHFVEGAIATVDSLVSAEYNERIGNRIEDRLGAFALVDHLFDTGSESGHICERQHDAADLAIVFRVWGYPDNELLVLLPKIGPGFHSASDDLAALLFQTEHATKHGDIAGRPTDV